MAQGRPSGIDPRLAQFAAGLLPILGDGDVAAFRSYLGRWEELLGDLSELADASDAELRRTMRDLRLRPGQFGLPPWPRTPPTGIEPADALSGSPHQPEAATAAGAPPTTPAVPEGRAPLPFPPRAGEAPATPAKAGGGQRLGRPQHAPAPDPVPTGQPPALSPAAARAAGPNVPQPRRAPRRGPAQPAPDQLALFEPSE
jgi:hypothetical protein